MFIASSLIVRAKHAFFVFLLYTTVTLAVHLHLISLVYIH